MESIPTLSITSEAIHLVHAAHSRRCCEETNGNGQYGLRGRSTDHQISVENKQAHLELRNDPDRVDSVGAGSLRDVTNRSLPYLRFRLTRKTKQRDGCRELKESCREL